MSVCYDVTTDNAIDDLDPDVRSLAHGGRLGPLYRSYMTLGGQIACERLNAVTGDWEHIPLHALTEQQVDGVLEMRRISGDEEIALAIARMGRS